MDDFIGIFDSGIGGLTVYSKIVEAFKNENIVYIFSLFSKRQCITGSRCFYILLVFVNIKV